MGTTRVTRRAVLAAGVLLLVGCARPVDPNAPPTIRYGVDVCSRCGMRIDDEAFASAYRTAGGEVRLYDDLGEMALDQRERADAVAAAFVHDHETRAWLRADEAHLVLSPRLQTPMGFGVAASADEASARALAARVEGRVLGYAELVRQVEAPKRGMPGMGGAPGSTNSAHTR
jgi:copper chaperone NosL